MYEHGVYNTTKNDRICVWFCCLKVCYFCYLFNVNLSFIIISYKQQQKLFLCRFSMVVFISRTIIEKTSLTLMRDLAEASINGHPHSSAKPCPKIKQD